jgi:hypothetical protein
MTEALLYMAIGFLAASLLTIAIMPLIHERAVRLTVRRLENGLPLSIAEIQAEKDALRADFALSTRRLEMANERLREHLARLMISISRKDDQLRRSRLQSAANEVSAAARSMQSAGNRFRKDHRDAA